MRRYGIKRLATVLCVAIAQRAVAQSSAPTIASPVPVGSPRSAARLVSRVPSVATADSAIDQLEQFAARFPTSAARPAVLLQLAELLARRADARFAAAQRGGTSGADRPDYAPAVLRLEELLRVYPDAPRTDAALYTLGTLYASEQRYADAVRVFERLSAPGSGMYAADALFRLGDARFELGVAAAGPERRTLFAAAAEAYERAAATRSDRDDADLRLLSLYKLGWAHYNAADPAVAGSYERALTAFGALVDAYDQTTPEQQARLGLRAEALEYMAVAFTRAGGAEAAGRYFLRRGGADKLPVLRRVATALREQGDDAGAVRAYHVLRVEAPNDSGALAAQQMVVEIYERKLAQADSAQAARLVLINDFAPRTSWATANPALAERAATARQAALERSAQYALARAQKGDRSEYQHASELYARLAAEFSGTPAARQGRVYYAESLLGQERFTEAGFAYGWAAAAILTETSTRDSASKRSAEEAARNSIVAYDSALARAPADRSAQDSLFGAIDRLVAAFPSAPSARQALMQKGSRASTASRWDAMADAFRSYATRYPTDEFTPVAAKLVGDALFKQGRYADAQRQWEAAQEVARRRGRPGLSDSIAVVRRTAVTAFADTLIQRGEHRRAAEEAYVAFADASPASSDAPGALRDAIETYLLVVDGRATPKADAQVVVAARSRALEIAARLATAYPRYQFRQQYQLVRARLLGEANRRDEAIAVLRQQVKETAGTPAAADPRLRLALALDSAAQRPQAAAAYEEFATEHPADPRATDALYNAAVTYAEARQPAQAARVYALFADRYAGDPRAGRARLARLEVLRASGDSVAAGAEFAGLCARSTNRVVRAECSDAAAKRAFDLGVAAFAAFRPERLVIATREQLNATGVQRASANKQELLRRSTARFEEAIRTGSAEYVAAATYYIGLAQYEYGDFLKNVELPATLNESERAAALNGASTQANQYYRAAEGAWQALIEKAGTDPALATNPRARPWLDRARATIAGTVDRLTSPSPD